MSTAHLPGEARLARRRPLSVGAGLLAGAAVSLGLWGLIAAVAVRLLAS